MKIRLNQVLGVQFRLIRSTISARFRGRIDHGERDDCGEAGFSLLELLVVLAILALLAGLVAPRVIGYLGGAKTDTAKMQLRNIESALDLYRLDAGKYPASLDALVTPPAGEERWRGPYLKKATGLTDPWGETFQYRSPGQHGEYDVYSFGADKTEGGDGEDQDIKSW
jgi:general secretion pathway protein G